MSSLYDKNKNASQNLVTNCNDCDHHGDDGKGLVILFFIVGLIISLSIGWILFPRLLYSQKQQPFNFNHVIHINEVDNGCESCHYFRSDGSFSGIPKNKECIECHEEIIGESDDELVFLENYLSKDIEVPWFIYSKQPNCVFFSHAPHLKGSKSIDCYVCHGYIDESEVCKPYEYNIITGYSRNIWGKNIAGIKKNSWDRMKMNDCANCHKQAENVHNSSVQTERDACFVCHK